MSASVNTPPSLVGVLQPTLQTWLAQAQQALQDLSTGAKVVNVSYAQGMGNRSVTYAKTNIGDLREWIGELQVALGMSPRRVRSAVGVIFR